MDKAKRGHTCPSEVMTVETNRNPGQGKNQGPENRRAPENKKGPENRKGPEGRKESGPESRGPMNRGC